MAFVSADGYYMEMEHVENDKFHKVVIFTDDLAQDASGTPLPFPEGSTAIGRIKEHRDDADEDSLVTFTEDGDNVATIIPGSLDPESPAMLILEADAGVVGGFGVKKAWISVKVNPAGVEADAYTLLRGPLVFRLEPTSGV